MASLMERQTHGGSARLALVEKDKRLGGGDGGDGRPQSIRGEEGCDDGIHLLQHALAKRPVLAQAKLDKATPEEVGALKTKAADLKNEVAKEKEDAGAIRKELARLKTQLTEEEIRERTRRCEKSVAEKRERLQKLEKASGSISKSKFSETRLQLQNNLVLWRKHRKSFYGIWNQIMESMETANEKKLMDDVCIETDEAAGVKFADLNELVAGSAAAKKRKLNPL